MFWVDLGIIVLLVYSVVLWWYRSPPPPPDPAHWAGDRHSRGVCHCRGQTSMAGLAGCLHSRVCARALTGGPVPPASRGPRMGIRYLRRRAERPHRRCSPDVLLVPARRPAHPDRALPGRGSRLCGGRPKPNRDVPGCARANPEKLPVRVWYPAETVEGYEVLPYFSRLETETTARALGEGSPLGSFFFPYLSYSDTHSYIDAPLKADTKNGPHGHLQPRLPRIQGTKHYFDGAPRQPRLHRLLRSAHIRVLPHGLPGR